MVRTHNSIRWLATGLGAVLLAAAMSSTAVASNGGTSAGTSPAGTPVSGTVGSTAGTITFVPANVIRGNVTTAEGMLSTSDAGQPVSLEVEQKSGLWVAVASQTVAPDGGFAIPWRATGNGQFTTRVVSGAFASTSSSVSTPTTTLDVFVKVIATWYGPGFYGHRTACGQTLTTHILGVADRTLPCGTPITLDYNGRTETVPVIDRGPYANGATFDLTYATARSLGILETVNIGYVAQVGKKIAPTNWYPGGSTPSSGASGASGVSGASGASGASGTTGPGPSGASAGGAQAPN